MKHLTLQNALLAHKRKSIQKHSKQKWWISTLPIDDSGIRALHLKRHCGAVVVHRPGRGGAAGGADPAGAAAAWGGRSAAESRPPAPRRPARAQPRPGALHQGSRPQHGALLQGHTGGPWWREGHVWIILFHFLYIFFIIAFYLY